MLCDNCCKRLRNKLWRIEETDLSNICLNKPGVCDDDLVEEVKRYRHHIYVNYEFDWKVK